MCSLLLSPGHMEEEEEEDATVTDHYHDDAAWTRGGVTKLTTLCPILPSPCPCSSGSCCLLINSNHSKVLFMGLTLAIAPVTFPPPRSVRSPPCCAVPFFIDMIMDTL